MAERRRSKVRVMGGRVEWGFLILSRAGFFSMGERQRLRHDTLFFHLVLSLCLMQPQHTNGPLTSGRERLMFQTRGAHNLQPQLCSSFAFKFVIRDFTLQSQLISDNKSRETKDLHSPVTAQNAQMSFVKVATSES